MDTHRQDRSVTEAKALYEAADYSSVVELLVPRVESAPGDARAWQVLGAAYFELGLVELAEDATSRVVELNPGRAIAHSNWGSCLRRLGQYDRAQAAQREALRLNPHLKRASVELAKIREAMGEASADAAFDLAPFGEPVAPMVDEPVEPVVEERVAVSRCTQCGVDVVPGRTLCPECVAAPQTAGAGVCTRCGAPVAEGLSLCADCIGAPKVRGPLLTPSAKRGILTVAGILAAIVAIVAVLSFVVPMLLEPAPTGAAVSTRPNAPMAPARPAPSTPAPPPAGSATGEQVLVEWTIDPGGISPTETAKPRPGYKHVVLRLAITNHGYDRVPTSERYCRIRSQESGMSYKPAMVDTANPLSQEDIPAGHVVVGQVPFEVVQTDQAFILSYAPSSVSRKYNVVVINPVSTPAP